MRNENGKQATVLGLWVVGIALVVALVVWLANQGSVEFMAAGRSCRAEGELTWPIDRPASQPRRLGKNYLQFQGSNEGLHRGIDIVADAGTTVRAVEDGRLVYFAGGWTASTYEFVIASGASPLEGFRYVHVDPGTTTRPFGLYVHAGQPLGTVASFNGEELRSCIPWSRIRSGCYDHLHLERVRATSVHKGRWIDFHAVRNPLRELTATNDDEAPAFRALHQTNDLEVACDPAVQQCLGFYLDQQPWEERSPSALEALEPLDIVARVLDRPHAGSVWENVPYCSRLTIWRLDEDGSVYEDPVTGLIDVTRFESRFDVEWEDILEGQYKFPKSYFESNGKTEPEAKREYYIVLTNQVFEGGCWVPEAGTLKTDYRITAEIFDSAGNMDAVTMTVTVAPSSS